MFLCISDTFGTFENFQFFHIFLFFSNFFDFLHILTPPPHPTPPEGGPTLGPDHGGDGSKKTQNRQNGTKKIYGDLKIDQSM